MYDPTDESLPQAPMDSVQPVLGGNVAQIKDDIRSFADRMNNLLDQREALNIDISAVRKKAKDAGINGDAFAKAIKDFRAKDPEQVAKYYESLDLCREALGMLAGTPLGDASVGLKIAE